MRYTERVLRGWCDQLIRLIFKEPRQAVLDLAVTLEASLKFSSIENLSNTVVESNIAPGFVQRISLALCYLHLLKVMWKSAQEKAQLTLEERMGQKLFKVVYSAF